MGGEAPESAIGAAFGPDVAVSGLKPLSSGASRRSWRFEVTGPAGRPGGDGPVGRFVLQQEMTAADPDAPADLRPLSMPGQAALMEAAARAGVPVAPVVASGHIDGIGWLVCHEMDGEALPPRMLRDPALAPALARLSDECARALSALHGLDPAPLAAAGVGLVEQDRLAVYRRRLDDINEPRPVLELAYRWLMEHRPEPGPPVVVHGDFRLGNLLVSPDGLQAVLDWELAHLGDRHEDVAWAMIRAWRFDRHRPPGVFPDRDAWPAAYDRAGRPRPAAGPRGARVVAGGRHLVLGGDQRHAGPPPSRRLGAQSGARGHRAAGVRVRVGPAGVAAVTGEPSPGPAPAAGRPGRPVTAELHGRPTAAELLDAVAVYLRDDLSGRLDGPDRHMVRIAVHALEVVTRELALGPGQAEAHADRLAALGFPDDGTLAAAIRSGALADSTELRRALVADTTDRLLVANPQWLPPPPAAP